MFFRVNKGDPDPEKVQRLDFSWICKMQVEFEREREREREGKRGNVFN